MLMFYSTTLCLVHRTHMPPAWLPESKDMHGESEVTAYSSKVIAYQAAGMITSIIEVVQVHDQLRYTPAFMCVSSLLSRFDR